jgi:hypothetical protein
VQQGVPRECCCVYAVKCLIQHVTDAADIGIILISRIPAIASTPLARWGGGGEIASSCPVPFSLSLLQLLRQKLN